MSGIIKTTAGGKVIKLGDSTTAAAGYAAAAQAAATVATAAAGSIGGVAAIPINQSLPTYRNLVDPALLTQNQLVNSSGATISGGGSSQATTGPIPCSPGQVFTVGNNYGSVGLSQGGSGPGGGFFNASGWVSAIPYTPPSGSFTIPANVTYFIGNLSTFSSIGYQFAYITPGSVAPTTFRNFAFQEAIGTSLIAAKVRKGALANKASLLSRADMLVGYYTKALDGTYVATGNTWATAMFPCDEVRGFVSSLPLLHNASGSASVFFDAGGNFLFSANNTFTGACTSGSTSINVTATANGLPLLMGTVINRATTGTFPAFTNPIGSTALSYITGVPANGSATGNYTVSLAPTATGTFTDLNSGGSAPGVALIPPAGFGVALARTSLFYYFNNMTPDAWDLLDVPFAAQTATSGLATHSYGIGLPDLEKLFPWFRVPMAVLGNSAFAEYLNDHFCEVTKADLQLRGAVDGTQMHQFLDGCRLGTAPTNRNAVTGNTGGVLTSADFAGIKGIMIGTIGPNEAGYNVGVNNPLGNDTLGFHRQPYPLGTLGDTAPVAVFQVTTTAGSAIVTVSGFESGLIVPGSAFPANAPNGLAGKVIQAYGTSSTTGTGGNGTYAVGSGTGITALTAAWTITGTFYGTLAWLCITKLGSWAPQATQFLVTGIPRWDVGTNGGVNDATNPGNPINSLGLRASDYADAVTAFGRRYHFPVIDMFYNTQFGVNSLANFYAADGLHPLVTRSPNISDAGTHVFAGRIGRVVNHYSPALA